MKCIRIGLMHIITGLCCLEGPKMSFERPRFCTRYPRNFAFKCLPFESLLKSRWGMLHFWLLAFYFHKKRTLWLQNSEFLGLTSASESLLASFGHMFLFFIYITDCDWFLRSPRPLVVCSLSNHGHSRRAWLSADWAGNARLRECAILYKSSVIGWKLFKNQT